MNTLLLSSLGVIIWSFLFLPYCFFCLLQWWMSLSWENALLSLLVELFQPFFKLMLFVYIYNMYIAVFDRKEQSSIQWLALQFLFYHSTIMKVKLRIFTKPWSYLFYNALFHLVLHFLPIRWKYSHVTLLPATKNVN